MCGRGTKTATVVATLVAALAFSTVAGAEIPDPSNTKQAPSAGRADKVGVEVGQTNRSQSPGSKSRPSQDAELRTQNLERKKESLKRDLTTQWQAEEDSRIRVEESIKAAYRGEDLAAVTFVLDTLLSGDGTRVHTVLGGPIGKVLTRGRESIKFRRDAQRALRDTIRQVDEKREDSEKPRSQSEEEGQRTGGLIVSIGGSTITREETETRITELEAADEAGEIVIPPVSGTSGPLPAEQEIEIAQDAIVAEPVEEMPYERYVELYKAAAEQYGFEKDWYVLAAVGKVESNHGDNVGPSGAGAIGPMQFLPSTWQAYGVDGNDDGIANIMDPEDAIPSAASYLREGGAPDDWNAALFFYNHSGDYVRKVLGVAEGYRKLARDNDSGPYA